MRVKICGITTQHDALAAAAAGADFVGLILAPSPRQVTIDTARAIAAALPRTTPAVLVFRDLTADKMLAASIAVGARWVQLHGHEPVSVLTELRRRDPGLCIIKAWEVVGPAAEDELAAYLRAAAESTATPEVILLDVPKNAPHPGVECLGAVCRHCRTTCEAVVAQPFEIWCAGGLTADNVASAIAAGIYEGVDVAGGVELRPGIKDPDAVRRFIVAAKGP